MIDQEEKIEEKIRQHKKRLNSLRPEAREIVQEIYKWYFIQKCLNELPPHIKETVENLDKFAYGGEE